MNQYRKTPNLLFQDHCIKKTALSYSSDEVRAQKKKDVGMRLCVDEKFERENCFR